jgi:hypothetical protein
VDPVVRDRVTHLQEVTYHLYEAIHIVVGSVRRSLEIQLPVSQ